MKIFVAHSSMFLRATNFNGDVSGWDVGAVKNMG